MVLLPITRRLGRGVGGAEAYIRNKQTKETPSLSTQIVMMMTEKMKEEQEKRKKKNVGIWKCLLFKLLWRETKSAYSEVSGESCLANTEHCFGF